MNAYTRILLALLAAYIGLVFFTNRAVFTSRFDEPYWKDKFEHSQWNLPLSVRTIGDDGLYLYEGYRLMHGGDPTLLNAEVPPLGKYLIGAGTVAFGNGYLYGLTTTLLLVAVFYLFVRMVTYSRLLAAGGALLLATDPLITQQYTLTMLDALHGLTLMSTLLLMGVSVSKKSLLLTSLAGVCIGLFSETKFPLFTPVPLILSLWYLWRTHRHWKWLIGYLIGAAAGYLVPYVPYFFSGHTLLDWLKIQKWIAAFYLQSNLTPTWGSAIVNIFTGNIQNIYSRIWETAPSWSPVWPIATVSFVYWLILLSRRRRPGFHTGVLVPLGISLMVIFAVIPFWTRYLLLLLPLCYLGLLAVLIGLRERYQLVVILLFCCVNIFASLPVLFPTPKTLVAQFTYDLSNMFFSDVYEHLDNPSRYGWDRKGFNKFGMQTISDGEIEKITITVSPQRYVPLRSSYDIGMTITAATRHLGSFTQTHKAKVTNQNGQWKLHWQWSDLVSGLSRDTRLVTTVEEARRGSILASDKTPLARDTQSYMVWITPGLIIPVLEGELMSMIHQLFPASRPVVYLHQRIYGNSVGDIPVAVGVIPRPISADEYAALTGYRGVTLTPHIGRFTGTSDIVSIGEVANTQYFECCSHLYTTATYDGVSGVELTKNETLKGINGGSLVIKDLHGTVVRSLITQTKRDGGNVQL